MLRELPKSDLHCHLDGSLRLPTLVELARDQGVVLPAYSEDGLRALVFRDKYANLGEYLQGFAYTTAVLRDASALERAAFELGEDAFAENVAHLEVRLAPQLLADPAPGGMTTLEVLRNVDRGLRAAAAAAGPAAAAAGLPGPSFSITACMMRAWAPEFSPWFAELTRLGAASSASEAVVADAIAARDEGLAVVAVDLAGDEHGYPAVDHQHAFDAAHKATLMKTCHAGEAHGAESIFQAVTSLHVERIGHGFNILNPAMLAPKTVRKLSVSPEAYVHNLAEYIARRGITLEVCPTSNLQTMPSLDNDLTRHSFRDMLDHGLAVTVNTDNRLVSRTDSTTELGRISTAAQLSPQHLREVVLQGFRSAFVSGSVREKVDFVRAAEKQVDRVMEKHGYTAGQL